MISLTSWMGFAIVLMPMLSTTWMLVDDTDVITSWGGEFERCADENQDGSDELCITLEGYRKKKKNGEIAQYWGVNGYQELREGTTVEGYFNQTPKKDAPSVNKWGLKGGQEIGERTRVEGYYDEEDDGITGKKQNWGVSGQRDIGDSTTVEGYYDEETKKGTDKTRTWGVAGTHNAGDDVTLDGYYEEIIKPNEHKHKKWGGSVTARDGAYYEERYNPETKTVERIRRDPRSITATYGADNLDNNQIGLQYSQLRERQGTHRRNQTLDLSFDYEFSPKEDKKTVGIGSRTDAAQPWEWGRELRVTGGTSKSESEGKGRFLKFSYTFEFGKSAKPIDLDAGARRTRGWDYDRTRLTLPGLTERAR